MAYPESGADTANHHAEPSGFRYGAPGNEGELTLPRASAAPFGAPAPACWHVHLELRPEELVALHRLGLTKGAVAWREGMPTWQPLREASEHVVDEEPSSDVLLRSSVLQAEEEVPDWSDAVTIATDRFSEPAEPRLPSFEDERPPPPRKGRATLPPTSPLLATGARPYVPPLSTPPLRNSGSVVTSMTPPPPPPPPPIRSSSVVTTMMGPPPPPPPVPYTHHTGRTSTYRSVSTTLASGGVPSVTPARLPAAPRVPSFPPAEAMPNLYATQPVGSGPPPPTVFDPVQLPAGMRPRRMWIPVLGLAVVCAAVGSFAAGVFDGSRDDAAAQLTATRGDDADSGRSVGATVRGAESPAPIQVDQLPLAAKAAAEAAPLTTAAPEPAPSDISDSPAREARSAGEPSESRSRSAARPTPERERAPEPEPEPAAPSRPKSVMEAIAAAAGAPRSASPASSDDDEAPSDPPASTGGSADLKAISRAVSSAARSASSCGTAPQSGKVAITFSPSGAVRSVQLEDPYAERDVGACVLRAMGRAKVAPFSGDPVVVKKTVSW